MRRRAAHARRPPLLTQLTAHAVPTALVSASHRRIIDRVLQSLGPDHFTVTVAGDEVPRTQAPPRPVPAGGPQRGRADPARCAVVEDTPTGVAAAEAAGCRVVAVPRSHRSPPPTAAPSSAPWKKSISTFSVR